MESISESEDSLDSNDCEYLVSKSTSKSKSTQTGGKKYLGIRPSTCYLEQLGNKNMCYNELFDSRKSHCLPMTAVCNNQSFSLFCHLHNPVHLPWYSLHSCNAFMPLNMAPLVPLLQYPRCPMVMPTPSYDPCSLSSDHHNININSNNQLINAVSSMSSKYSKKRNNTSEVSHDKRIKSKLIGHKSERVSKPTKRIKKLVGKLLSKYNKVDDIKNNFVSDTTICTSRNISKSSDSVCCRSTADINYESTTNCLADKDDSDKMTKSYSSNKDSDFNRYKTTMLKSSLPSTLRQEPSRENSDNRKVVKRYISKCLADQDKSCKNLPSGNCTKIIEINQPKEKSKVDCNIDNKLANILCDLNADNEICYNNSNFYNKVIKKTINIPLKESDKDISDKIATKKENTVVISPHSNGDENIIKNSKINLVQKNNGNVINKNNNHMLVNFNKPPHKLLSSKEMYNSIENKVVNPVYKNSNFEENKNELINKSNLNPSGDCKRLPCENFYSKTNSQEYSNLALSHSSSSLSQSSSSSLLSSSSSSSLLPFSPSPVQPFSENNFKNRTYQMDDDNQFDHIASKGDEYNVPKSSSSKIVSYNKDAYYTQQCFKSNLSSSSQNNNPINLYDSVNISPEYMKNKRFENNLSDIFINSESSNYNKEIGNEIDKRKTNINKTDSAKSIPSHTSLKVNEMPISKDYSEKNDNKKKKNFESIVAHFLLPNKNITNTTNSCNSNSKNILNNIENNSNSTIDSIVSSDQNSSIGNKNFTKISFSVNYDPNNPESITVDCAEDSQHLTESTVGENLNDINNIKLEDTVLTEYETDDISKIIDNAMKNNFFDGKKYEENNNNWGNNVSSLAAQSPLLSTNRRTRFSQYSVLNNIETLSIISEEDEDSCSITTNRITVANTSNTMNVDSYSLNQNCKEDNKNNDNKLDDMDTSKHFLSGMYYNSSNFFNTM